VVVKCRRTWDIKTARRGKISMQNCRGVTMVSSLLLCIVVEDVTLDLQKCPLCGMMLADLKALMVRLFSHSRLIRHWLPCIWAVILLPSDAILPQHCFIIIKTVCMQTIMLTFLVKQMIQMILGTYHDVIVYFYSCDFNQNCSH